MTTKRINIREIASLAKVSTASVSRALRESSPYLKEETRREILEVCAKFHYYPNEHTRRMFSRRADTVALFFPPFEQISKDSAQHIFDMNFGLCMMGAQETFAAKGINLLLTEVSERFKSEQKYLKMSRGKAIDGILIWGALNNDDAYIRELLKENVPLIMLRAEIDDCDCTKVVADDYAGMSFVTTEAVKAGHRNIAAIRASETSSGGKKRMQGIYDVLNKHNIKPVFETKEAGYGYSFGQAVAPELIASKCSCVIASDDMTAWGCIDAFTAHNIKVPDGISICGGGGLNTHGSLQLCSFRSPAYEIGRFGAELLLKKLNGEISADEYYNLPIEPIKGNSIKQI